MTTKYTIKDLMIICETNNIKLCEEILKINPELINKKYPTIISLSNKTPYNPGSTLIHYAARSGHYDMVKLLINKYKANSQIVDHENWNILHYSCIAGHYNITKLLIEIKVNDKIITLIEKCTPLQFAKYKKWNDIIKLFDNKYDEKEKEEEEKEEKEYKYSLKEKQEIFEKTKRRLNKLMIDNDDDKKLDLYMHRYKIDINVYKKLKYNLCHDNTPIFVFKCIDTELKKIDDINNGIVFFIIYHDRKLMTKQRCLFEKINGIRVIRSGSISRLDHIIIFVQIDKNLKIKSILNQVIDKNEMEIVGI